MMDNQLVDESVILSVLESLAAQHIKGASDCELFTQLCNSVVSIADINIWRAAVQLEDLHPIYYGYCLHWYSGQSAYELPRDHEFAATPEFQNSPYELSRAAGGALRLRLDEAPASVGTAIEGMRAAGTTEIFAQIAGTHSGMPPGISWATRNPEGFSDAEIDTLRRIGEVAIPILLSHAHRKATRSVLETYLGRTASAAVADGHVRPGDVQEIEAIVLLTDLRGFTAMSRGLDSGTLLRVLNTYCDAVTGAVNESGGDVLKFIGDGILSIFQAPNPAAFAAKCEAATAAVADARGRIAEASIAGPTPLRFVAALHAGRLAFGNVGARNRLDFTVLGDAVNVASRIEAIAKKLRLETIATGRIADAMSGKWRSVGSHTIAGVTGSMELFSL